MKRIPLTLTAAPLLLAATAAFAGDDPFAQIPLLHDGSNADCQQYSETIRQLDQQASHYRALKEEYDRNHQDEMKAQAMAQQQQMMAQYNAAMASGDYSALAKIAQQQQQQAMAANSGLSTGLNTQMQCLADLESAYNRRVEAARAEVAQRVAPDTDKLLAAARNCAQPSGSLNNVDRHCMAPAAQSYKTALAAAAPLYVSGINDAVTHYRSAANACLDKGYAAQRQSAERNALLKPTLGGLADQQNADRYDTARQFAERVQASCNQVAQLLNGPGDQPFGDHASLIVYRSFTSQPVGAHPAQKPDLGTATKKALDSLFGK